MSLWGRALGGVPKIIFCIRATLGKMSLSHHVLSCHVPPLWGAIGGYWCWPGANSLFKWSTNVQKYMASGPRCPVMSCHVPPCGGGAIGSYWCWPGMNGLLKWSTNVQKYMASGPRCHIISRHVPPYLSNC